MIHENSRETVDNLAEELVISYDSGDQIIHVDLHSQKSYEVRAPDSRNFQPGAKRRQGVAASIIAETKVVTNNRAGRQIYYNAFLGL